MAENVNEIMEKMAPELQDLEANDIFSHEEIASIIRKRRNMEYALYSYSKTVTDYITAIEYEINLDTLRKMRKRRLGLDKPLISDYSIRSRIYFIFERMVRKYKGDLNVWLKYVDYVESSGNTERLNSIYPRILALHPRAESIWIRASNWEMEQGDFQAARTLLQRAIRINKKSELIWREYFRFELVYINIIEERRRILGLPSLKERLLGDKAHASLNELVKEEELAEDENVTEKQKQQEDIEEAQSDLEILNEVEAQEEKPKSFEIDDSDEEEEEKEKEKESRENQKKNKQLDSQIANQSEETQIAFLQGAIPKVVFNHALQDAENEDLLLSMLKISYELNNIFVEKYILNTLIEQLSDVNLESWKKLLMYPFARIVETIKSEDECLQKKKEQNIQESIELSLKLKEEMINRLEDHINQADMCTTIISAFTENAKVIADEEEVNQLYSVIEDCYSSCKSSNMLSASLINEMIKYYASKGNMTNCVELIFKNKEMLFSSLTVAIKTLSMLVAIATRSSYIITDVMGVSDINKYMKSVFQSCLKQYRDDNNKELYLQLYVRFLKYLISINDDSIENEFKNAFMVCPELNAPVFILYLSFCNEQGIEKAREAINYALTNEVLIPLDNEVIEECIECEKRHMAGLESTQRKEKEKTIQNIEKLYDIYCKRYSQRDDIWIEYIMFERGYNQFDKIKKIYNRAIHALQDISDFEAKYNLIQSKGHL